MAKTNFDDIDLSELDAVVVVTENTGAIGGTNDGNLPDLIATYAARTGTTGGTANGVMETMADIAMSLSTSDTYTDAAVNAAIDTAVNAELAKMRNNIQELLAVIITVAADNVALRAAIRETAAAHNALLALLKG